MVSFPPNSVSKSSSIIPSDVILLLITPGVFAGSVGTSKFEEMIKIESNEKRIYLENK
jgi:hypothetical protein